MSTVAAPTGGANNPLDGISTPTSILTLSVGATSVETCGSLPITWTIENPTDAVLQSGLSLIYKVTDTSQLLQSSQPPSSSIGVEQISTRNHTWSPVWIYEPGRYTITALAAPHEDNINIVIRESASFVLALGDTSCLAALTSSMGSMSSTSVLDASSSPSLPESEPSSTPSGAPATTGGSNSKIGAVVGGTVAACLLLAILIALLICRRRRQVIAKNAKPKSLSTKSHQRTWGGLSSIDKLQGEIPVIMPAESQYAYRTRSHSTGLAMAGDDNGEKDKFPVDAELLAEMPSLDGGDTPARRYSTDALSAVLRQNSGFTDQHARNMIPSPAAPVVSRTTATFNGGEDPFSDTAFISHGKRTSMLSVPTTARAPSRISDVSSRNTPSPLPSSALGTTPPSQQNTMTRNTSATASVPRPTRKPVPQYTEDSIELTKPTLNTSRPGSASRQGSSPSTVTPGELSASSTSQGHLTDTSLHWLHDRVPVANRNIGLAGQGEGPVHYLIPDMPSSTRE